jgi:anaerobic ribonucleoside-triphosphate reductase activating protein
MLPFEGGMPRSMEDLKVEIRAARDEFGIEGISLLGGEPLAHAAAAAALAREAWELGLSVMVYSGYTLAEAHALSDPAVADVLAQCDILVDGPYLRELPEPHRRWVGSANQVVHFLTKRYRPNDAMWVKPNTLEIRLRGGELSVNGFPAPPAAGLWRRLHIQSPSRRE